MPVHLCTCHSDSLTRVRSNIYGGWSDEIEDICACAATGTWSFSPAICKLPVILYIVQHNTALRVPVSVDDISFLTMESTHR